MRLKTSDEAISILTSCLTKCIRWSSQSDPPPPPPPSLTNWWGNYQHRTRFPKTPRSLIKDARQFQKKVPSRNTPLHAFIRGAIANTHFRQLAARDLKRVNEHSITKAARSKLRGTVAAKFEVITVIQIRAQVSKQKEREEEKIQVQRRKLDASLLKEHQKAITGQRKMAKLVHKELMQRNRIRCDKELEEMVAARSTVNS